MMLRKGAMAVKDLVMLGLAGIVMVVGIVCYTNYAEKKAEAERIAREKARAEQMERERLERERQQKEEEEFERKKREARLAREREEAEREAARLAKEKAEKEAEAERQRKQEEIDSARKGYRMAQALFSKEFRFVSDKNKSKLPYGSECAGEYWCVFSSYAEDHLIYKISFDGGVSKVQVLSSDSLPTEMSESEFKAMYEPNRAAVTDGSTLWMKGVKLPGGYYEVPPREKDFRILELQIGKLYDTFAALGMEAPQIDCRVTLKSDSGKTSSVLGVFDIDEVIGRDKMEEAASAAIGKKLGKESGGETVKRKNVRQTVVLYDGLLIKTDAKGVIHVPRVYSFHGTNQHTGSGARAEREFRAKWKKLHAEALRQEKLVAEAEAEYRAACAAAQEKSAAKSRENSRIAGSESVIDAALAKCKLLVEIRKKAGK